MEATRSGQQAALQALFAADAQYVADGGGKVLAVLKALHGAPRIARFFEMVARQAGHRIDYRHILVNGEPGLARYLDGRFDAAISFITDGERIRECYLVRNPDKLRVPESLLVV